MKAWHRWLALGLALAGTLSACGARTPAENGQANNLAVAVEPPPAPLPARRQGRMTLTEAVDAGVATVVATGQDLTTVRLRVTATEPVQLTIPVGTLLTSGDAGTQNMMTAVEEELALEGTPETPATREIVIAAYCINFHRDIPSDSSSFSVTEASGEAQPLKALADCLEGRETNHRARQLAMWAISDRFAFNSAERNLADSLAHVRSEYPQATAEELARAEAGYRAFFEEIRANAGPLLDRCGHPSAGLPLFAQAE